ncbi:MAG: ATP-grasp domain-containing protein [Myxococcales bacterium]|nr:ATP-grasp domain-containing protein [Myxococcales bacterium]
MRANARPEVSVDVLFLSPAYPPEMQQFTRGLAEVGARVWGVGDAPLEALPDHVRRNLAGYLRVPAILDEDDTMARVLAWLGGRKPDRVEGLWEVVAMLAARLRDELGVPGMSPDTVHGFRDKVAMKERVAAAGVRIPRTARASSSAEIIAFARTNGFPIVVKPIAGAGSADTFRVDDMAELGTVLDRIRHVREVSVEEFVAGQEYTFETICVDGRPLFTSVSQYVPNTLIARQNEWISPIILALRDPEAAEVIPGVRMGHDVLQALHMGTGFTHMEWFASRGGEAVFGEVACRPPGANMVDLMNYANDVDLFREWARAVVHRRVEAQPTRPYNAAIIFKRAKGRGRIAGISGLERFVSRYRPFLARVDLLPIGAPRRNWKQTFLSDGNLVVRHPDRGACLEMAMEAASTIAMWAE